ncbi:MAG: radical SAM protein, partial [Planctomycetota bacterium]
SFCIDSTVRYQPQHPEQIHEDLVFVQKVMKDPFVGWYDPNFGVRFDETMEVIERAAPNGGIRFVAESSLSLLGEANLKRLGASGFVALLPGVESWFDHGEKAGTKRLTGMEKVRAVADHMNLIHRHVPYTQANFVLGLDSDEGAEPFELTKRLVDLVPATWPGYSLFTAFGNSAPLFLELEKEERLLDIPFPLLDNNSALNIRLKNYRVKEFYDHLIDLVGYSFSPRRALRRFRANQAGTARWLNLLRAVSSEGRGRHRYHRKLRSLMDTDTSFVAFLEGESAVLPEFFRNKIRVGLGPFFEHLPDDLKSYLQTGIRRLDRAAVTVLPGAGHATVQETVRKAANA